MRVLSRLCVVFGVVVGVSFAAMPGLAAAATQVSGVTIVTVGIYTPSGGTQGAYVTFSPANPGLEGCTYNLGNELWIDATQAEGKALYASVLAASLAGRTVTFGVSGCANSGQVPLVYRVDVWP